MRRFLPHLRIEDRGWLRIAGIFLASLFVLSSIQRFSVHPSGAHVHRQADTIGMSIAFSEELSSKGMSALDFLLYPKILQKGLLDGINASEFPLLNVIMGFGFSVFTNPWMGVFLGSLLILLLNFYVALTQLPRLLRHWHVEVSGIVSVLLWFTGTTLAGQTNVIMPEGVAFPLVIAGVAQLLENQRSRYWAGVLLCSLSIAIKPTVVIALGSALLLPLFNPVDGARRILRCCLALLFPAWWYVFHVKHVLSIAQGPQIFAPANFSPIARLSEVGLSGLAFLFFREPHQGQFPMFFGWVILPMAFLFGEQAIAAAYLLAIVGAIALDGAHIFDHSYYFIGSSIFGIILMARLLGRTQGRRPMLWSFVALLVCWGVVFNIRTNVWIWARDSQYWKVDFWRMGKEARSLVNQRVHLVTDDGVFPQKLLFMGRSGTAAGTAIYSSCEWAGYEQMSIAFITDLPPPANFCGKRARETKTVETPFAKWFVTLVQ